MNSAIIPFIKAGPAVFACATETVAVSAWLYVKETLYDIKFMKLLPLYIYFQTR